MENFGEIFYKCAKDVKQSVQFCLLKSAEFKMVLLYYKCPTLSSIGTAAKTQ